MGRSGNDSALDTDFWQTVFTDPFRWPWRIARQYKSSRWRRRLRLVLFSSSDRVLVRAVPI